MSTPRTDIAVTLRAPTNANIEKSACFYIDNSTIQELERGSPTDSIWTDEGQIQYGRLTENISITLMAYWWDQLKAN